ncbi:hypothetical protein D3C75_918390 [compost metagenome]
MGMLSLQCRQTGSGSIRPARGQLGRSLAEIRGALLPAQTVGGTHIIRHLHLFEVDLLGGCHVLLIQLQPLYAPVLPAGKQQNRQKSQRRYGNNSSPQCNSSLRVFASAKTGVCKHPPVSIRIGNG